MAPQRAVRCSNARWKMILLVAGRDAAAASMRASCASCAASMAADSFAAAAADDWAVLNAALVAGSGAAAADAEVASAFAAAEAAAAVIAATRISDWFGERYKEVSIPPMAPMPAPKLLETRIADRVSVLPPPASPRPSLPSP